MPETGETHDASPENPSYKKIKQDDGHATQMFMITVDEGWRTWILCTEMYEWAADGLLEVLCTSGKKWPR
jgi:hypothetical protein